MDNSGVEWVAVKLERSGVVCVLLESHLIDVVRRGLCVAACISTVTVSCHCQSFIRRSLAATLLESHVFKRLISCER